MKEITEVPLFDATKLVKDYYPYEEVTSLLEKRIPVYAEDIKFLNEYECHFVDCCLKVKQGKSK